MFVPRYWARAEEKTLCCLGWSDASMAEAERLARGRLETARRRSASTPPPDGWDYYPTLPVKEEILDRPAIPGLSVIVTRNRAGASVLNADSAAFVDVDLPPTPKSAGGFLRRLFGSSPVAARPATDGPLPRIEAWAAANRAFLRVYRTTRGLRLLRMDRPMDPAAAETEKMFEAVGADPQYRRLCRIQKSFRARLTPKPARVATGPCPGSHPRTDPAAQRAFAAWLSRYESACRNRRVCELVADYGNARILEPLRAVADLHDRAALAGSGDLV